MCGLFAQLSFEGGVRRETLERGTSALGHRGPDGRATWVADDRVVGLGHTRLALVDVAAGSQPIANEDGSVRAIVNGELYGYADTMAALSPRHAFRSRCDSEIVVHLYEERGEALVEALRGEFAFVLWDARRRRLVAARDRFGIKPLFYWQYRGELRLASEVKALWASGVRRGWDAEALFQHLFIVANHDRTLFEGVRQVPPGHLLVATPEGVRLQRYWDLDYAADASRPGARRADDIRAEFQELLRESVRLRMHGDVPAIHYLSGGLDSSAVLATAAELGPQSALNVRFEGAYDESPHARAVAREYGAVLHEVQVTEDDVAARFADAVASAETLGHFHAAARFIQGKAAHDLGFKVALTGDGGDELFGGYAHQRADAARAFDGAGPRADDAATAGLSSVLGATPPWLAKMSEERAIFWPLLRREFADAFSDYDLYSAFLGQFDVPGQLEGRSPARQGSYLWLRSMLPNYMLFAERLEMAHGVETRLPLLDHKLFECVRDAPAELLERDGRTKCLLRESQALKRSAAARREKHPFAVPRLRFGAGEALLERLRERLSGPALQESPFFDQDVVIELLERAPSLPVRSQVAAQQALAWIWASCELHTRYALGGG